MSSAKSNAFMSSDKMLGIAGSALAAASVGFGLYMNMHGPAPGGLGHSQDFTVFAQLAPRRAPAEPARAARPATTDDALDTTATASIAPTASSERGDSEGATGEAAIISSMVLEDASRDVATIAVGGRVRTVRVGDDVPGAGEVLEIKTGPRAAVRTSLGLIVAAHQD